MSDSLSKIWRIKRALADIITFSDSLSKTSGFSIVLSDSFLFTDSPTIHAGFKRSLVDSINFSDLLTVYGRVLTEILVDSFTISDSLLSTGLRFPVFRAEGVTFIVDNQITLKAKPSAFTFLADDNSIILKREDNKFTFKLPKKITIKEVA